MHKKKMSDADLILAVQSGDEQAFEMLYQMYYKLVYYIAYELCRNDADAKDVSQETFVQVKKSIGSLQDINNFKPWLNRITINKCKNLFRANKTANFDMDDPYFQNNVVEDRNYMLPEANLHLKSDQDILHELISKLPLIQREVLLLRFFENLSMKEMAYVLDIPEGTVKTRLLYGKDNLKKMVQEYEHIQKLKLDFHSDAAISAVFASGFAALQVPKAVSLLSIKKHNSFSSGIVSTTVGKIAIVGTLATTGGIGAVSYYQATQKKEVPLSKPIIQSYVDTNARTLYFELMNWASCEQDIKAKTKDEILEVSDKYETLKQGNSAYYKRLIQDQWAMIYEELLKTL